MRIKGHPAHMMLVHFPSALLPVHFLLNIAGWWTGNAGYIQAAALILPVAVIFGWLAMITGAAEFLRLLKTQDNTQISAAALHAGINLWVLGFYSIILALHQQWQHVSSAITLSVEGTAIALLVLGNFFGGAVVTKYLGF